MQYKTLGMKYSGLKTGPVKLFCKKYKFNWQAI